MDRKLIAALAVFLLVLVAGLESRKTISRDPDFSTVRTDYMNSTPVRTETGPWKFSSGHGWIYNGTGDVPSGDINITGGEESDWLILMQPVGKGPIAFRKASVRQDVLLPFTGRMEMVAKVANINHLAEKGLQSGLCEDSYFEMKLKDRLTGREYLLKNFTVRSHPETFRADISRFRGRPVVMILEQKPGGSCGLWRGERSTVLRFSVDHIF
ncbi:MAG: hypothetical protein ABEJ99_06005 [Candidatus Nanohaloarchaea archaeon]